MEDKCELCGAEPMTANCNNANCMDLPPSPNYDYAQMRKDVMEIK